VILYIQAVKHVKKSSGGESRKMQKIEGYTQVGYCNSGRIIKITDLEIKSVLRIQMWINWI
jgi:hypothetical protein